MGCGSSKKNQVDFSELDRRREELGLSNGHQHSVHGRKSSLMGGPSELVDNWAKQAKPIMDNMILTDATPKLSKQITATAAVVMGSKFHTKEGAQHLMNVFVPPLEDVASFAAPVYPKSQVEKKQIREALKNTFLFSACLDRELRTIVDAFQAVKFDANEKLIVEGDVGDYFYVLKEGKVRFEVQGKHVGYAGAGTTFGELALLYSSPRSATVVAESDVTIYRVDQKTFRYIMQSQLMETEKAKKELLQGVGFLKILDPSDIDKLVHAVAPRVYREGEAITQLDDDGDTLYVIQEGKVLVTEANAYSTKMENEELGPGDYFGESALLSKDGGGKCSTVVAVTKVLILCIDRDTFDKVVGDIAQLAIQAKEKAILAVIPLLKKTGLEQPIFDALAALSVEETHAPNSILLTQGETTTAKLFMVRSGKLRLTVGEEEKLLESGDYFGESMLEIDMVGLKPTVEYVSQCTVVTLDESVTLGTITIECVRKILDTTALGEKKGEMKPNGKSILLKDLKKHKIIGAGTFGQVWLVSHLGSDGENHPYALKVQSKYQLIKNHQAKGVVAEKRILERLNHPFLSNLATTYQDTKFIYMLLDFVQGGELYSILHSTTRDGIDEDRVVFYSSGILEGLSHMHRRLILYRDLKPENVMIDREGYPVIIDFGFAKYVKSKTYTLCGTPLYLAPEVILNRGHDKGADHWSFGVLIYEMLYGVTPFYTDGIDQMQLFRAICNVSYRFPIEDIMSPEVEDLIQRFFVRDPAKRLGSLANGIMEIYGHPWFKGINFGKLRQKELKAPWIPDVTDPFDTGNFESWDHLKDSTETNERTVSPERDWIFKAF